MIREVEAGTTTSPGEGLWLVGSASTDQPVSSHLMRLLRAARPDVLLGRVIRVSSASQVRLESTSLAPADVLNVLETTHIDLVRENLLLERSLTPQMTLTISGSIVTPAIETATWGWTLTPTIEAVEQLLSVAFAYDYPFRTSVLAFPALSQKRRRVGTSTARIESIFDVEGTNLTASVEPESSLLARRVALIFHAAQEERFEDGIESAFSRALVSMIQTHGNAAIATIEQTVASKDVNTEVAEEALRWIASVDQPESHKYRLWLLQGSLRSPSARIRDAAGLGLAAMDHPSAIPPLQEAITKETSPEVREGLQLVLDQLVQTAQWRSS